MRTYAFIPARYQSIRFPGKPLAFIDGKPMIQRVYERALSCSELEEVYVATDDERISACLLGFGGKVVMTGQEHRSGTDRISEAARLVGLKDDDLIVNIQGDQPLFDPSIVSELIKPLQEDPAIPMATLKFRIREGENVGNPNHVKVVADNRGFAIYFSRYPIPYNRDGETGKDYYKHLGFYAYRMDFLQQFTRLPEGVLEAAEKLEQLRVLEHGFKIKVSETSSDSIEVDVPEDVKKVEELLHK